MFIRSNLDTLSKRITDDCWILIVTERWYHGQMGMLATWLTNRMDKALHPYQCTCLSHIVQKMYNEYEMHGMTDEKIRTAHFSQVNIHYIILYNNIWKLSFLKQNENQKWWEINPITQYLE